MNPEKIPEKNPLQVPESEHREKEPVTIEVVETENAEYRIVRSAHILPNSVEELGKPDFVALETGQFHYRGRSVETIEQLERHIQYRTVLDELRNREMPIYFVDVPFSKRGDELIEAYFRKHDPLYDLFHKEDNDEKHPGKKILAGALSIVSVIPELRKMHEESDGTKKISRREFLKSLGKLGAGLFLQSPLANPLYDALDRKLSKEAKVKHDLKNEYLEHDELIGEMLLAFRNAVMAAKLEHIALLQKQNLSRKPQLSVFVGAAHVSLNEMGLNQLLALKENPEATRSAIINRFLERSSFSEHVVDPKEITRISSVRFLKDSGRWQEHEDYDDYLLGSGRG